MQPDYQRLILTPARLARLLTLLLVAVFSMHGLALFVAHGLGYPVALGFVPLFNVDFENNVPTFVAFGLLLCSALTCAWTSALESARPRHRRTWAILSLVFLFLAADEALSLHEQLGDFMHARFDGLGLPLFAWVLPYGLAVLLAGAYLLRWFLELERPLQVSLLVSGGIFLFGAIGLEFVASGLYTSLPEDREVYRTLSIDLLATVEEACEFIGVSLFLHTMVKRLGGVSFRALGTEAPALARQ
jgi:hypothetical protein